MTRKCNTCNVIKEEDEFNPSDIKARRYTCKICKRKKKRERKQERLNTIDYSLEYICTQCNTKKSAREFYDSYLVNYTYICKPCGGIMSN